MSGSSRDFGAPRFGLAASAALAAIVALTALYPIGQVRAQTAGGSHAHPASGKEVLQRMHDHWATGTPWFHTLTFKQQTTVVRPDGTKNVSTWYEALLAPDRLRIDFGDPSEGNGVIYTADSVYVVRSGKVQRTEADGNPFLPFVIGVYTQPLEQTLSQLEPLGIDMSRVRSDSWQGRPVWVVGAAEASDTTSAQFWVDSDRLVLLRMVLAPSGDAGLRAQSMDIHLDKYVETGGGWLATKVVMYSGGVARQTEEYSDWRTGVELSPDFFVVEKWGQVPHWTVSRKQ
jgi:hypothetical protein